VNIRFLPDELLEVLISSPIAAGTIDLEFRFFITGPIFYLPGKINAADIKEADVDIVI
jgi:hypothetical protein